MDVITITKQQKAEKKEKAEKDYIKSLTEIEKLTMEIAKNHLGSSFDIQKSNGFLK